MKRTDTKLAWTSDPDEARRLRETAAKRPAVDAPPAVQTIRVTLDGKRRKGKTVTVASGFELTERTLGTLAGELKKRCGAGGTSRDSEIEIQGEHLEAVAGELAGRGFRVKR